MLTVDDYICIKGDQQRQDALMEAHTEAKRVRHKAAALYATEAALRTRMYFPDAARIEFEYEMGDGVDSLEVYDADGKMLHGGWEDDFDDESEITDMLTDAMDQDRLFFGRPDGGIYTFEFAADLAPVA